jgi:predicted DNA-binding transcriptional regulator AlpA
MVEVGSLIILNCY